MKKQLYRYFLIAYQISIYFVSFLRGRRIDLIPCSEIQSLNRVFLMLSQSAIFYPHSRIVRLSSEKLGLMRLFHPEAEYLCRFSYSKIKPYFLRVRRYWFVRRSFLDRPIMSGFKGIVAFHEHNSNYFHFLIETCASINRVCEELSSSDMDEYCIYVEEDLPSNMYMLLEDLFPLPVKKVPSGCSLEVTRYTVFAQSSDRYYLRELDSMSVLRGTHSETLWRFDLRSLKKVREVLLEKKLIERYAIYRSVFIKRSSNQSRKLLNSDELCQSLQPDIVLDFSRLSISEQISVFHTSELIVASTGAYLANIVFAAKSTRILVLCSDSPFIARTINLWKDLATVAKCRVDIVYGEAVSKSLLHRVPNVHSDFLVNRNELDDVLYSHS